MVKFQPIQIAKDAKNWRLTVRKNILWREDQGIVGQTFAGTEEIRHVIRVSHQPSLQKPGIDMRLHRKDLWMTLLCNNTNPCDIHRDPKGFVEWYTSRNTASLD